MGISTYGRLAFGVVFDADYKFPWDSQRDGDIEDWWLYEVHGFKHSKVLFDEQGEYLNGVRPPEDDIRQYFAEIAEFLQEHPLPVQEVTLDSVGSVRLMLAVPGTVTIAYGDEPSQILTCALTAPPPGQQVKLLGFCLEYGLMYSRGPGWFLSASCS